MDTPASVAVRTAFGTRDIAQRVVEFLPFDEVCGTRSLHVGRGRFESRVGRYFGRLGVKAACRGLRNAARRALTRGRWRPICRLAHEGVALVREFAHKTPRSCPTLLTDAWARDRGAVMLTLMADPAYEEPTWIESFFGKKRPAISLGSRFLQLVERTDSISPSTLSRDSSGFMRIMDACEYAFGILRSGDLLLKLLYGWLRWRTLQNNGGWFYGPPDYGGDYRSRDYCPDIAEPLGAALEAWRNPRTAAQFVVACWSCREVWDKEIPLCSGPNLLIDWVAWFSRLRWTDQAKARIFADHLNGVAKEVLRNEPDQDDEEYWGG
jgi:hypothetical protein